MKIINTTLEIEELKQMSVATFGNMVKAVVDVEREIIAVDSELHADLEALFLADGSNQKDLWGVNLYTEMQNDDFVEFDSMINMRPSQGNRSRSVESADMRKKIIEVITKRVKR